MSHDDSDFASQRFALYRARYDAGESIDLAALATGLTASERDRFESLVDEFLADAPRRPFNAQAFKHSGTAEAVRRSVQQAADDRREDQ
jgi:type IV pilus biogenesis protein CpaD/CtpE